jgi:5-bromo-4-chloroindolyl phosphate hydrolysis protein
MYTFKSSVTFKIGVKAMKVVRIIKKILAIWVTGAVAVPVSYFGFSTTMIQSFGISIGLMVVMSLLFIISSVRRHYQNPYREEIAYVRHQVKEARKQLRTIGSYRFKIRSVHMWTELSKLYKVGKSIIEMVEKEPARYKDVQPFFTNYLQSTVTVIERYMFLLSKPTKSIEVKESLHEAEDMLRGLSGKYEHLLTNALSQDKLTLDVELKVLKQAFEEEQPYIPTATNRTK